MKQNTYKIYNEYGTFIEKVEGESIEAAIKASRRKFPLKPFAIEKDEKFTDLIERKEELEAEIYVVLNQKIRQFQNEIGLPVSNIELQFNGKDLTKIALIDDVKIKLSL